MRTLTEIKIFKSEDLDELEEKVNKFTWDLEELNCPSETEFQMHIKLGQAGNPYKGVLYIGVLTLKWQILSKSVSDEKLHTAYNEKNTEKSGCHAYNECRTDL